MSMSSSTYEIAAVAVKYDTSRTVFSSAFWPQSLLTTSSIRYFIADSSISEDGVRPPLNFMIVVEKVWRGYVFSTGHFSSFAE